MDAIGRDRSCALRVARSKTFLAVRRMHRDKDLVKFGTSKPADITREARKREAVVPS